MVTPKSEAPAKKVRRISERTPRGEWLDMVAPVSPRPSGQLPEVSYGNWVTSSYDLLDGTDVIEDPDTMPGALFDELFAPKSDAHKKFWG